ncbi:MAG: preprotein translocase subunit SecG [Anaerolineae bacterium]|nr:preprotein translocase subunit SecG [Anaerolineae bacterium]
MNTYLYLAQIVIALALIVAILLQAKGASLGGIFGGDGATFRTRRGLEKTLYQATIGLSVAFFALSILTVVLTK